MTSSTAAHEAIAYVVLHTDYRNHAGSDEDPDNNVNLRLGCTEDVIAAAGALRAASRPAIDDDRIGLMGRSMGGGVVCNILVVAPGVFDTAVAYAPVSGRPEENIDRFQRPGNDPLSPRSSSGTGRPRRTRRSGGRSPPLTYAHHATEPLLIHHGTADTSCPIAWPETAAKTFEAAGTDVELVKYHGEGHTFGPRWADSMDTTLAFFERHLR